MNLAQKDYSEVTCDRCKRKVKVDIDDYPEEWSHHPELYLDALDNCSMDLCPSCDEALEKFMTDGRKRKRGKK